MAHNQRRRRPGNEHGHAYYKTRIEAEGFTVAHCEWTRNERRAKEFARQWLDTNLSPPGSTIFWYTAKHIRGQPSRLAHDFEIRLILEEWHPAYPPERYEAMAGKPIRWVKS